MTTRENKESDKTCPAQALLKLLSGKWKPEIFRLAVDGNLRFSGLLRDIRGTNRQTLAVALREMEDRGLLLKVVVKTKPLHIEYHLTDKAKQLIPIFKQLENFG